jgi:DNA-binding MarR family transcriptional regulator
MPAGSSASARAESGLGRALRRGLAGYWLLVDNELAEAGFADRRFPDGRVLVMCSASGDVTISEIGRRLGVTRQRAGKVVARLRENGYVDVSSSAADGREKVVTLTPRARQFLAALGEATRRVEDRLASEIGPEALDQLIFVVGRLADLAGDVPASRQGDRPLMWLLG